MDITHLLAAIEAALGLTHLFSPQSLLPEVYVSANSNCVLTFPVPIHLLLWSKK